ncbi:MAG: hypothetical protein V4695_04615 [Pseudomonadota bacterium]
MKAISQKDIHAVFEFTKPLDKVAVSFPNLIDPESRPYTVAFKPMQNDLGMVDTLQPLRKAIRKQEVRQGGLLKQCFGMSNMPTPQQIADKAHEVGKSLQRPVISDKAAALNVALCNFLQEEKHK